MTLHRLFTERRNFSQLFQVTSNFGQIVSAIGIEGGLREIVHAGSTQEIRRSVGMMVGRPLQRWVSGQRPTKTLVVADNDFDRHQQTGWQFCLRGKAPFVCLAQSERLGWQRRNVGSCVSHMSRRALAPVSADERKTRLETNALRLIQTWQCPTKLGYRPATKKPSPLPNWPPIR